MYLHVYKFMAEEMAFCTLTQPHFLRGRPSFVSRRNRTLCAAACALGGRSVALARDGESIRNYILGLYGQPMSRAALEGQEKEGWGVRSGGTAGRVCCVTQPEAKDEYLSRAHEYRESGVCSPHLCRKSLVLVGAANPSD